MSVIRLPRYGFRIVSSCLWSSLQGFSKTSAADPAPTSAKSAVINRLHQ